MAPFNLMTAGVSWLAKSFSVFSCTSTLARCRCTSVLPATYINQVKCLSSQASGPPKRPLNGYMRYVVQQKPLMIRNNPEIKAVDIIRMIAQQWRTMSPDQKRPFEEASLQAREQFKMDLQRYQAQLTPAQVQQQTLEKRQRMAKRKAIRKKRAKMKSLLEDWRNLFSHQKKVYTQLAEDDKIRYKNEIKSWEDHMIEIGREDLVREQTLSTKKKKPAARTSAAKKGTKKAKAVKKVTTKGKAKTIRKTTTSTSTKTARTTKKT
ncbi:transcription factor A, mitochondrial isoform X2 [Epinephelus lanceolatus]|uniref:transcription factor A, mitochondrial isoform X2 n=1 Tax=Epinephelus lanceolatus TaxID=310571 RepID=UPI0014464F56|nr:transcription factor A, mitochondrial isoform X2 [Epinephelus lanceolatus]